MAQKTITEGPRNELPTFECDIDDAGTPLGELVGWTLLTTLGNHGWFVSIKPAFGRGVGLLFVAEKMGEKVEVVASNSAEAGPVLVDMIRERGLL